MSDAKLRQLEADNRVLQDRSDRLVRLEKAVKRVYQAGFWSCDRLTNEEAKHLFTELRDAARISPGGSPVPVGLREEA